MEFKIICIMDRRGKVKWSYFNGKKTSSTKCFSLGNPRTFSLSSKGFLILLITSLLKIIKVKHDHSNQRDLFTLKQIHLALSFSLPYTQQMNILIFIHQFIDWHLVFPILWRYQQYQNKHLCTCLFVYMLSI